MMDPTLLVVSESLMEPTILVVSESEKHLGWTYPKRAKGLIKNGRAFWLPGGKNKVLVLKQKETKDNESKSDL